MNRLHQSNNRLVPLLWRRQPLAGASEGRTRAIAVASACAAIPSAISHTATDEAPRERISHSPPEQLRIVQEECP
jgi:hypothetical protein